MCTKNHANFSLVITNYNRSKFIDRAIRSCQNQLVFRTVYEIIIVDDCSTDNSLDIIHEFRNEVRLFVNDKNRGVAYASNVALRNARGKYLMRVDADDFLNKFACAYMSAILDENPDIAFVYCDHYRVDVHGVKVSKVRLNNDKALYEHGAGIMFRTEALTQVGGYDESLRNCEDYDLLVRLKNNGYCGYYLPVPLYRYYIHGENITLSEERTMFRNIVEKKTWHLK